MSPAYPRRRTVVWSTCFALLGFAIGGLFVTPLRGQDTPDRRDISVEGGNYRFSPQRVMVRQDDLVKITFHASDMPHSFTVDAYRIAKRAAAGQAVVFEFRADQAGTFPIYCNLSSDERCKEMVGELVVSGK
jgi:heme/copper-type cytochrome/quinol oxidase subunit 2